MFILSLDKIFFVYLLVSLSFFSFFWVVSKINEYRFRYKPKAENLFRCPICLFVYISEGDRKIIKCPRCSSLSDVKESRVH